MKPIKKNPHLLNSDCWLEQAGPHSNVVVSSRARLARNLRGFNFVPYAKPRELEEIARQIEHAVHSLPAPDEFLCLTITSLDSLERLYLKESRLISAEMEKGGEHRAVYLSTNRQVSLMVNEEDHLRMQSLKVGFSSQDAYQEISQLDDTLTERLDIAFNRRLGYLTACPTNVGTGLRVSVMLHLPALVFSDRVDKLFELVKPYGLVIRGFYGENTGFEGDLYQLSNEVSLGKAEEEIIHSLEKIAQQLVDEELQMRRQLFEEKDVEVEDAIWRSFALLNNVRKINSLEAMKLLSSIRLGLERGYFENLTHHELNRLIIDIQPAHIQYSEGGQLDDRMRDVMRAALLRKRFHDVASAN